MRSTRCSPIRRRSPAAARTATRWRSPSTTGPGPTRSSWWPTLDRLHVHATFFAIGNQEQYFSAGTVAEVKSGDVIGDHTETHPMMASSPLTTSTKSCSNRWPRSRCSAPSDRACSVPPTARSTRPLSRELHHLHLLMILWSVDTADYTLPGYRDDRGNALAGAKPGAIILMHDAGRQPLRDDRRAARNRERPAQAGAAPGDDSPAAGGRPTAARAADPDQPELAVERNGGRRQFVTQPSA